MIKKKKYLFWAKLFNPIIIVVFTILVWLLINLADFGNLLLKLPFIILFSIGILTWFIWCIIHFNSWKKQTKYFSSHILYQAYNLLGPIVFLILCIILGTGLYRSANEIGTHLNNKVDNIFNVRSIKVTKNNIYNNGLNGIFSIIDRKINLPDELYVSPDDPLKVTFNRNGKITLFEGYLSGKNKHKAGQTYLITYDANKDKKMTIIRSKSSFDDTVIKKANSIEPLLKITRQSKFSETLKNQAEPAFDLYYAGTTQLKATQQGIVDIRQNSDTSDFEQTFQYNVPIYTHGETAQALFRFFDSHIKASATLPEPDPTADLNTNEVQSFRTKKIGYRLQIDNAALGTYYYKLAQTNDGGRTWTLLNNDPFHGEGGTALNVKFLTKSLGFVALMQNSGTTSKLYRTENGGQTFSEVTYTPKKIALDNQDDYEPFVAPDMPTKTKNDLQMKVGQGVQGDYEGGLAEALYHSSDDGKTWSFVKIIHHTN